MRGCLLALLILLGLACSTVALRQRIQVERTLRSADILIDYNGFQDLCQSEGLDSKDTLAQLRQAGVTAVAFPECSLDRLSSRGLAVGLSALDMSRALRSGQFAGLSRDLRPDPKKSYLVVTDQELADDLQQFLSLFLGPSRVALWQSPSAGPAGLSRPTILQVSTTVHVLAGMGLGFSRSDVQTVRDDGLGIWLRPQNRPRFTAEQIGAYFQRMAALKARGLIFEGANNDVIGYPDLLEATESALEDNHLLYGNVEAPVADAEQKGGHALARRHPELTVRVLSIPVQQQLKMSPDDAVDRYRLGARERNMRVLYVRFFTVPEAGKTVLQTNLDYIQSLREALQRSDIAVDGAQPFPEIKPGTLLLVGMTLGAAAAGVLLLELFVTVSPLLMWTILGGLPLLAIGSAVAHRAWLAQTGMALVAAMAAAVLGMARGVPMLVAESREAPSAGAALRGAIFSLILVTAVSLVGGVYMAGLMSSTPFMLSIDIFRGIKLIMVAAPIIAVLLYVTRQAPERHSLVDILGHKVALWQIFALAILAAAGAFYVIRTGNASPAAASDLERTVRDFLENMLVVRPRFKEFALGHPAWLVMAVLLWKRRGEGWLWLLVLAASIGQVDVVDTFAHAHTPYLVSLVRAVLGLAIGIGVGVVAASVTAKLTRPSSSTDC